LWFVDLPGVDIADAPALDALRRQIAGLPSPRVHLVLNAAYEMPALLAQWRAFEPCGPEDLIFTHLDEETRRVKLWNFVFGTNCSLRFLGAGQKIPGEFRNASPEILLPAKNP
jgi:flagellar biosynthesis GTPase FlhF